MKTMKGVNVPISCPMTPDQQVDYKSLDDNPRHFLYHMLCNSRQP